jgi:RNA polymerase sigma-70 factor (ECF subfamily)
LPEVATDVSGRIVDNQPPEFLGEAAHAAMLSAVDRLPEHQRLALVTTKLQQRTMAQAASILGTTEGALKVRAHRAYAALRAMLSDGATA